MTTLNVGTRLQQAAEKAPDRIAVAQPLGKGNHAQRDRSGKRLYQTITFGELAAKSRAMAAGFRRMGVCRGTKMVLMVRPGADFVALVYALFLSGAVVVMIDPGMGLKKMLNCLAQIRPDGFVAVPEVQFLRLLHFYKFKNAKLNVTVGNCPFFGKRLKSLIRPGESYTEPTDEDDPAAIIFTSGSTGPAKGVLYTHKIINAQADEIGARFDLSGGGVDLAGFPFFGLYDAAHGTTMVVPDMDTTRPASVNPELFFEAAMDWNITQSFASPALWNRVVRWAAENHKTIPTLRRAMSSGAPFPVALLPDFLKMIAPEGDIFTPYGATESLPVAAIGAREILSQTAEKTKLGRGVCVGKKFDKIRWKIIPISDEPFPEMEKIPSVEKEQIGELAVTGPQVTQRYVTSERANALSKITDSDGTIWHRIGDLGWIDADDRFWFCGRKAHRVESYADGTFFSVPCESIFNLHPNAARSALAGYSDFVHQGFRIPVMFIEPKIWPQNESDQEKMLDELRRLGSTSPLTNAIQEIRLKEHFPVDIRHNAKINREQLSEEAESLFASKK